MTALLVIGGLAFVVVLLIVRPLSNGRGRLHVRATTSDEDRRRELLRQLRDLDDDLAAGKLTAVDHERLRDPIEREAAAVLSRIKNQGRAGAATGAGKGSQANTASRPGSDAHSGGRPWRRRTVALVAFAGAAASVTILLAGAVTPRSAGQNISGDAVGPTPTSAGSPSVDPSASSSASGQPATTPDQLAAIDAAVAQVEKSPKDATAHLALADAYAAGGQNQLAAVEYLAVTQLDPTNAEANTELALLAFQVGQAAQAKTMVDRALTAHPNYPDALYARALILLMGLNQPKAAERDLNAYLAAAPFGSHRTAAETLLALASSQDHK
ncbi:MAG TPA: tetratricopeptide repeat protein [Micromonosporaceae bacterium]